MAKTSAIELSIKIAGRVDGSLSRAITDANRQVSSLSNAMSAVGKAGLAAMATTAVATSLALADCVKEASAFEKNMANVAKYVEGLADSNGNIQAEPYNKMKDAIQDLSTQIPMTTEELTQLAAAAGQSGKSFSDLIQYDSNGNVSGFLKDTAMMATAMDISAEQAGDWAAKWEMAFDIDHGEVMRLADQINYLGAHTATTAAEIAEVVNSAASLGQVAGMTPATTAAIGDAMLAMGVDSGAAATSVRRLITNVSLGTSATKKQKEAWQELGLTAEGVAKSMQTNSVETLRNVFTKIGELDADKQVGMLKTLFGQWSIEGAAKITGNIDALKNALDMVNDEALYSGSMEKEFNIKVDTEVATRTMMLNAFTNLRQDVGDYFLPAIKELEKLATSALNRIGENLPDLSKIAESSIELLSRGVEKAGDAFETALPKIQAAIDYMAGHGPEVTRIIGGLAAAFTGMTFAPTIEKMFGSLPLQNGGLLGELTGGLLGAGSASRNNNTLGFGDKVAAALFGAQMANSGMTRVNGESITKTGISGWWQKTMNTATGAYFGLQNADRLNSTTGGDKGLWRNTLSLASQITEAKKNGGLLGMAENAIENSGPVKYIGGIGSAMGNFFDTGLGGMLKKGIAGTVGVSGEILKGISDATGLTDLAAGTVNTGRRIAGWAGGKVTNAATFVANSAPVQMIGSAATGVANSAPVQGMVDLAKMAGGGILNTLGAGAGVLGSVAGPLMGMFAGAAPIVAGISTVIALFSILGDNAEGVRNIIQNTFGDAGVAVFDTFAEKLAGIGQFVAGLFEDGGVANVLAPLRETVQNMFGENGAAAFDGLTSVLQSVMGIVGQVVSFAETSVKPIILSVYEMIVNTVVPGVLSVFTQAAPYIAQVISGLGTAFMSGMTIIADAIQFALPIVQQIIAAILTIGSVVVPAAVAAFGVLASGLATVVQGVQGVLEGLISFITGAFTGNWQQAWEGVKQIFGSAFDALVELCKAPINAVIAIINTAISGINNLGLKIPEWVPVIGGQNFAINIPQIPMLANGGMTNGVSIAGEAGPEAVISFKPSQRARNIALWEQAGTMLGVENDLESAWGDNGGYVNTGAERGESSGGAFTFAPNITITGNASKADVQAALNESYERFCEYMERFSRTRMRTAY